MSMPDRVIDHTKSTIVWMWQQPWLATPLATATDLCIRYEKLCRQTLEPNGHRPRHPMTTWHDGGQGQVLLMINGFTASGLAWPSSLVRRLERRYRVIRIDNRGTGWARDAPGPFTIADMADDARDVLDALGVDRAVVYGMSMGGMIGQEFAIRHPDRIERLVVSSTIPPAPSFVPSTHGLTLAGSLYGADDDVDQPSHDQLNEAARVWLQFSAAGFEPLEEVLHEMGRSALTRVTPRRGAVLQARAIYAWADPSRLRRITTPTTVLHGAADHVIPPVNAQRIAGLIPHAKLVEVLGAGHLLPWEAEDTLVRHLGALDHAPR